MRVWWDLYGGTDLTGSAARGTLTTAVRGRCVAFDLVMAACKAERRGAARSCSGWDAALGDHERLRMIGYEDQCCVSACSCPCMAT